MDQSIAELRKFLDAIEVPYDESDADVASLRELAKANLLMWEVKRVMCVCKALPDRLRPWAVLRLQEGTASREAIARSEKTLSLLLHPDKNTNNLVAKTAFQTMMKAAEELLKRL